MKTQNKNRIKKSKRRAKNSLNFSKMEERKMFAAVAHHAQAVLDFDGEWMNQTQLERGQWAMDDFTTSRGAVSFPSLDSLFTQDRTWLDLDGNGIVNQNDSSLAIDKITAKVKQDFSPYDLNVFEGDQDSHAGIMSGNGGDVTVIISGGEDNTVHAENTRYGYAWGWANLDHDNSHDQYAFVFAGESVDYFDGDSDGWINQLASTVSHEMGHTFGLKHEIDAVSPLGEFSVRHSIMNVVDSDFSRDFGFHDEVYETSDFETQNAHQHLSRADILGPSSESWMASLKVGTLTIHAKDGKVDDSFIISNGKNPAQWNLNHNGIDTTIDRTFVDTDSMNPFLFSYTSIEIVANDGDNEIVIESDVHAALKAWTGNGDDLIIGGYRDDIIFSGAGDDDIYGNGGSDRLYGEDGRDRLFGGAGRDYLFGGNQNDYLSGGSDGDYLYGGSHNDYLSGGGGNDRLYGGGHNDTISGGSGNDSLFGQHGMDRLFGNAGADYLNGGDKDGHRDELFGGSGPDTFVREMYHDIFSGTTINRDLLQDFSMLDRDRVV